MGREQLPSVMATLADMQLADLANVQREAEERERRKWLDERRNGVGSSDVANIFGIGFRTALATYLDKIGELPDDLSAELQRGILLEDAVARMYAQETGYSVIPPAKRLIWSTDYPWLYCSQDRRAIASKGEIRNLEIKTATFAPEWGEPGTDQVPDKYNLQTQEQMLVSGIPVTDICVFFSIHDVRIYTVLFNPALSRIIAQKTEAFWNKVLRREPPELDLEHRSTPSLLAHLYQTANDKEIVLGGECVDIVKQYDNWQYNKRLAETKAEYYKTQLLSLMADASVAIIPGGITLKRKRIERKGYSVAADSYIKFSVHGVDKDATRKSIDPAS